MRRWKLSAAAVLFSMSAGLATIHAAGRDPYVGEYSMECPQAQCWLEMEKGKGKTYNVRFIAADRVDASKVLCRADIPMERGPLSFTATEQYEDGLSGSYRDDPLVWILSFGNGSVGFISTTTGAGNSICSASTPPSAIEAYSNNHQKTSPHEPAARPRQRNVASAPIAIGGIPYASGRPATCGRPLFQLLRMPCLPASPCPVVPDARSRLAGCQSSTLDHRHHFQGLYRWRFRWRLPRSPGTGSW